MSKNKSMRKNKLRKLLTIFASVFLIIVFVDTSGAILDCSMCHKTAPGNVAIRAADTIEINNVTCLKCHNSEYPPELIGYNTHLAHVGKYSAKVDYISRHPKVVNSLSCSGCHTNIGENCRNCHVKNIPHIQPPLGYNCKGCHGQLDKLFQHSIVDLKIHNIFGLNGTSACVMCHNPDSMTSLKLASGDVVSIQESHRLCFQCHSSHYNLWNSGKHYSNNTVPSDEELRLSNGMGFGMGDDIPAIRSELEDAWRRENTCVNCHNPHNPSELYQLPVTMHDGIMRIDIVTIVGSNLIYTGTVLIAIIVIVVIFIIKKRGLKLSELKLSDIKLPKLRLPKISIPVSISVEKDVDKPVVSVDKVEEKVDKPVVSTDKVPKTGKNKLLHKYRYDIAFILIICTMLGSFYVIFGTFVPMVIVASESMSPHIEKGDIIFYTDTSRIDEIGTYDEKSSTNFEDYGDVVIYKPLGQDDVVPYIHRARYYVDQGEEMWQGGPKAPHAGYITKGDNVYTNRQYDQQLEISRERPIKREWIIGTAKFRVPYIGYIGLILS